MDRKPEIGGQVRLKSFLGDTVPPKDCDPNENYWKLIGQRGKIIEEISESDQAIVLFENSISDLGLYCHNPVPNSLRIQWSDLESV